jgi:hypothetical protein
MYLRPAGNVIAKSAGTLGCRRRFPRFARDLRKFLASEAGLAPLMLQLRNSLAGTAAIF